MKKQITTIALIHCAIAAQAQAPPAIPYQAIARNSSGTIVTSAPVGLRFTIHDSSPSGTVLYSETHAPTTSDQGSFNVNIGQGSVVTGTFASINWGTNAKYLQVELDVTGGTSYVDMGTQQLLSVPFALYAGTSGSGSGWAESAGSIHNTNTTQRVGVGTTNPQARLHVADSSVVFTGPVTLGSSPTPVPVTGAGSRFMWVPQNSSLRAGFAYGTQWNADSIGAASIAMGDGPTAYGTNAIAMGHLARAKANNAVSIGDSASATNVWATALGRNVRATAQESFVSGSSSSANSVRAFTIGTNSQSGGGEGAFTIGNNSSTSGLRSFSLGANNNVSGTSGMAIGTGNTSTGALAMGWGAQAGNGSVAIGNMIASNGTSCLVIGTINTSDDGAPYIMTISDEKCIAIGGYKPVASNFNTTAFGHRTQSTGGWTTTFGYMTRGVTAAGTAMGSLSAAYGNYSWAGGYMPILYHTVPYSESQAIGDASFSMGSGCVASGPGSLAMGKEARMLPLPTYAPTILLGNSCFAEAGGIALAGGLSYRDFHTAIGYQAVSGDQSWYLDPIEGQSTAIGMHTQTKRELSTALGTYASTETFRGSMAISDASYFTSGDTLQSTTDNEMSMRFAGGYQLYTNGTCTIGTQMAPSSNSWAVISDKRKKENFLPLNGNALLRKLQAMPVTSWNYIGQSPVATRHYGPMAQDFYTAFGHDGVGTVGDDTTINLADMAGITLAAVQALATQSKQLTGESASLNDKLTDLEQGQKKYQLSGLQLRSEVQSTKMELDQRLRKLEQQTASTNSTTH